MQYVEAKIAKKEDVVKAVKDGLQLSAIAAFSEEEGGWRLDIQFIRDAQLHSYQGRLFRAPTEQAAQETAQKQLNQMLGKPREGGKKYSNTYLLAKEALERKIQQIWDASAETETDLIKPGPIKFNWTRKEPAIRVIRPTSMKKIEEKYNPEFKEFVNASKDEAQKQF
ncbi:hypothetical protein M2447_002181 [Ereboglobus sp. PH5-10]|uniref:hypothetical protein n=1 Tax=Ereboglobus TaxID=2028344 RepID=UPI0012602E00|nr:MULTISPECIES: hypothetical protein [Ereboglobus]MDF9828068.1 hypothetical protein [Ereboglobus sp. PH5-10]